MKTLQSFLNYRPSADIIKNNLGLAYLKLDLDVPYEQMLTEAKQVQTKYVKHRSTDKLFGKFTHQGWRSLTLHGASSTTTVHTNKKHSWTEIADECPVTTSWIKQNFDVTGRARFMLLEAGGYILPHNDREEKNLGEVNIALNNPEGCVFRFLDRGNIPFKPGHAYIIDTSNEHMVYNNSSEDRIHIIIHGNIDPDLLERSYDKSYYS
jgi:hypothetical protein